MNNNNRFWGVETDRRKKISDISKVLASYYCGTDFCDKCQIPECGEYHRATLIFNAGYRKRDEIYQKTKHEIFQEIYDFLREIREDSAAEELAWKGIKYGVDVKENEED